MGFRRSHVGREGFPAHADVPIRLVGVRADVDGVWMPRRVVHTLSPARGYRTEADIEVVTPAWERASSEPPPGVALPGVDGGEGGTWTPPASVEPPDLSDVVAAIAWGYPGELRSAGHSAAFVQLVAAALHGLDPRWGRCWRDAPALHRPTLDEVAYYRGPRPAAADASADVSIIQIARESGSGSGRWVGIWEDVTHVVYPSPRWYRP